MEQNNNVIKENLINILNSGIDMFKLFSDKEGFIEKGINLDFKSKDISLNIDQQNFSGTSNVYSPYLYYDEAHKDKNKINPTTTQKPSTISNPITTQKPSTISNHETIMNHENISNPDIHYENKRIELNKYIDILQ